MLYMDNNLFSQALISFLLLLIFCFHNWLQGNILMQMFSYMRNFNISKNCCWLKEYYIFNFDRSCKTPSKEVGQISKSTKNA